MQNFGMPGGAGGGGAGGNNGYGAGAGMPMMHPMPQPQGTTPMHIQAYKAQLSQFQHNQTVMFNQMAANGQITQHQVQQQIHAMNEKIRSNFSAFLNQIQQQHHQQHQQQQQQQPPQQGRFPNGQPEWRGPMAPPQGPPGQMQMSAAEKKKMAEIQKRNMMQQQQGMRMPPGATPQQQHQYRMQMQMQQQQQQQQQNAGYRMPMQGGQTPQYPGMQPPMSQGMQPLQHMQPPTPLSESHGPASVSNPAQQQFQQQQQQQHQQQHQQQQYYQQQQNQQMHMQHMQQQQMAQQQSAHEQQMAPPPQMQMQPAPQQAPIEAPPPQKPEDVKYKELLQEMKSKYLDLLHNMNRRCSTTKGLVQMINILEGDREVPYDRLVTLKGSLAYLLARDCPTFCLLEELRRVVFKKKEDREKEQHRTTFCDNDTLALNAEASAKRLKAKYTPLQKSDPMDVEPWYSVRHLQIKVPEAVRMLTRTGSPSPLDEKRKALKRGREEEGEEGVEAKKAKEEVPPVVVEEEEDITKVPEMFVIKPVFDTRRPWVIPKEAREELLQLSDWSIDEHCLPSCSETPFIVLCIKSRTLHVNPLRITLSKTYPTDPATVQFDRSFPRSSEHGAKLRMLFEKKMGAKGMVKTVTEHAAVFHAACDELQQFMPNYLDDSSPETSLQSQKTPEPVYPAHYTARPAATNAIAHKGMVM